MSKCLILVKYSIEENQLCEESERNIGSVDISDIIINDLGLEYATIDICVLEEKNGKSYEAKVIDSNCLSDTIKRCEELSIKYASDLYKGIQNDKQRNSVFDKLTALLNVRKIMREKQLKYKDDNSVFVVWG